MKKFFKHTAFISVIVFLTSTLLLSSYALYKTANGEDVVAYDRFHKVDGGKPVFNWYSLLFPVQTESQKIIRDTLNFNFKVQYPLAPQFEVVPPVDTTESERSVAQKLSALLADTLAKHKFNLEYDLDGQSLAVRDVHNIVTPNTAKPHIFAALHGTASPEAGKRTFLSSIQPGVLESGNAKVAQQRAERTARYLQQEIVALSISENFTLDSITSEELQFSETDVVDSSTAVEMLPEMRYARLYGFVPYERVEITPATAPITIPLWIGLLSLVGLAILLFANRSRKVTTLAEFEEYVEVEEMRETESVESSFNWRLLIAVLVLILIIVALVLLAIYFWKLLVGLILFYFLLKILNWLLDVLTSTYYAVQRFSEKNKAYWSRKPLACKIVASWFVFSWLLIIVALITYVLGYWHICF